MSMRRMLIVTLLLGLSAPAFANKLKKLEAREVDHYHALRVWMTEDQEKAFFKLKTPDARDQYLKDIGMWDRFYQYDEDTRKAIVAGDVQVGWKQDEVFMAWGEPADRMMLPGRQASRSEMFTYRFEVDKDGNALVWTPESKTTYKATELFRVEVVVDDLRVVEMNEKKGWDE